MSTKTKKDELSRRWLILSNLLPAIGLILYFRHKKQSPGKANKALRSSLMGIPGLIIGSYIFNNYFVC